MNNYLFYRRIRGPVLLLTFGVTALLAMWDILGFDQSWPLYLIVYGVLRLAETAFYRPIQAAYPGAPGYGPGFAAPGYAGAQYAGQNYAGQAQGFQSAAPQQPASQQAATGWSGAAASPVESSLAARNPLSISPQGPAVAPNVSYSDRAQLSGYGQSRLPGEDETTRNQLDPSSEKES